MDIDSPKTFAIGSKAQSARTQGLILAAALALSLALHFLALIFVVPALTQWMMARNYAGEAFAQKSLEKLKSRQRDYSFILVETPESARRATAPEDATYRSDKNAAAQNPNAPPNLPIGKPFATGASPDANAAPSPAVIPRQAQSATSARGLSNEASDAAATKNATEGRPVLANSASKFRREFLTGGPYFLPRQSDRLLAEAGLDNQASRAPEIGSFSLNTYAWEFAPYLLWLKNQIQRNIYPPPAFTHMGIINGRTILRFRISRDGILLRLELLNYEGHKSLMETSVRAVQLSAPFRALPKDFPEEYLEVTGHFDYIVKR
jgi:hypothetical protein